MQVVLLDMDGTLLEHRQKMKSDIRRRLVSLLDIAKVGIVSGSTFKDICHQCDILWDSIAYCNLSNLRILPCNGTSAYSWVSGKGWQLDESYVMNDVIGEDHFQILLRKLTSSQVQIVENCLEDFKLCPDFIDYRGSLINWCPIGRSSSKKERKLFVDLDKKISIRDEMIRILSSYLSEYQFDLSKITIAKGGQTSLDIFPRGWDKTFAFDRYEEDISQMWFVGDACEEGQNDYEIYQALKAHEQSFKTSGADKTIIILDKIINTIKEGKS